MRLHPMKILAVLCLSLLALRPASADERKPLQVENDVVYAVRGERGLRMDIARPKGKGPFPTVLFIHGGSWRAGNKAQMMPIVIKTARAGYVAATVEYRFAPGDVFPAQLDDVRDAVRYLREHARELHADPSHVGAIGFSAGAHLALLLGTLDDQLRGPAKTSTKVQCVVNFFGPTDLHPLVGRLVKDFLGGTPLDRPKAYRLASPLLHITKDDAPILTLHGTKDRLVPFKQALLLQDACSKAGVPHKLYTAEGAGHGWGGKQLTKSISLSSDWIKKYLLRKKPVSTPAKSPKTKRWM